MPADATTKIPANLDLCGGQILNAGLQLLVSSPAAASEGSFWYDSVNHVPMYFNGTTAKRFGIEYANFTGADGTHAGVAGLVPAPAATDNTKFLRGDGTFAVPTNTIYTASTGLTLTGTAFSVDSTVVALKSDITTVYRAAGPVSSASGLPTLSASVLGNVYNATASFTTTSDFVEGSGKTIQIGNDIAVVDVGTGGNHSYKFSVMGDFVDISGKQDASTAVKHTASTAVGSATKGVYVASDGTATEMTYSVNKDVPSNAVFTDTKNTAGSTDTSSKIFLVGATSQAANSQTYSHDTVFVDANGRLNSTLPAANANDATVATTAWIRTVLGKYAEVVEVVLESSLSPTDGVCTWTITTGGWYSRGVMEVSVFELSSNGTVWTKIYPKIVINTDTVVVSMLSSTSISNLRATLICKI